MKYILFIILAFLNIQVYAQKLHISDSVKIDTTKLNYCQKIIHEIDYIQLKCDTVFYNPWDKDKILYEFRGLYFDNENRLKKYWSRLIINDGSHDDIDFSAYYDDLGKLVYITFDNSNHCEEYDGSIYIYDECIVYMHYNRHCGCCEDEQQIAEDINASFPNIGDSLRTSIFDYTSFESFINAETLLEFMVNKNF